MPLRVGQHEARDGFADLEGAIGRLRATELAHHCLVSQANPLVRIAVGADFVQIVFQ